jgi:hypothetical protein
MRQHFLAMILALGVCAAATASADPVISVGSSTVSAGGVTTVNLDITGLQPGVGLGAFDIDVGFNPTILSFASAMFGNLPTQGDLLDTQGFGSITAVTPSGNSVNLVELSFDDPSALVAAQPSGFTLATLTFNALSAGVSSLMLSVNSLSDAFANSVSASAGGGSISVSGGGGGVSAPEIDPASAMSSLTLLLGSLAVLRARRAK